VTQDQSQEQAATERWRGFARRPASLPECLVERHQTTLQGEDGRRAAVGATRAARGASQTAETVR